MKSKYDTQQKSVIIIIMKNTLYKLPILIFCIIICSGSGYKGSLPDINTQFEYKRTTIEETQPFYRTIDEFDHPAQFKNVPKENPSYIDIILKKDKSSPYINDLNDVIPLLEKLQKCIQNNDSIQKFNAISSSIIDHADYIAQKYAEKPERYYISFSKLQNIAAHVRSVATLRCEALVYIKYLAAQGEGQIYSKDSLQEQIDMLERDLDITIKILKDST